MSTWASPQCITAYDINMYSISCPAPTALGATSITTTGATLNWTEAGTATSWEYEWDTAGFTQGSGTSAIVTSATLPLTGLSAQTSYEFYVRAGCGSNDSSLWAGPYSFTTACNAISSLPYSEDFDGSVSNGVWDCWNVINNDNDSYTWSQSSTYITARSGANTAPVSYTHLTLPTIYSV